MTPEEALKEGGYTLEGFRRVWEEINGSWDPDEVVWVYEFQVYNPPKTQGLNGFLDSSRKFANSL